MSFESNDHRSGSPTFTIKVTKLTNGQFQATCPTQPSVAAGTGATESTATQSFKKNLDAAVTNNTIKRGY